MGSLAERLFRTEPKIRYVAVNQGGRIVEMVQSPQHPAYNPPESDRIEELILNPIVLEITRRRGEIDIQGIRYVLLRYGTQYQLILPYGDGHASVGVELADDPASPGESQESWVCPQSRFPRWWGRSARDDAEGKLG